MDKREQIDWTGCDLVERIPGRCAGRPTIKGTRIEPSQIVEEAQLGSPIEEIAENYPSITRQQIVALLAYAQPIKSDLARIDRMKDEDIDYSDIPPLEEENRPPGVHLIAALQSSPHRDIEIQPEQLRVMTNDWEPIETAPKDGPPILVYDPHCGDDPPIFMAQWIESMGCFCILNDPQRLDPTHWMPVPPPPYSQKR